MEPHDQSHRQYAPNAYGTSQPQQSTNQLSSQYGAPTSGERFRQPSYLQQSPTATSPMGRAGASTQQGYGYPQSGQFGAVPSLPSSVLQYDQNNDQQSSQRLQQQQTQYQSYENNPLYGMGQPQTQQQQQPTQPVYEQTPQYRQQPSAATETLASQFGVPQNAQYYLAGQAGPTSAPTPEVTAQHIPRQYQQAAYPQLGSSSLPYPGSMMDPSQSAAYGTNPQQQQRTQYAAPPPDQSVDQAFNDYQARIRSIFTLVRDENLRDVGTHLLQISQYLLGNVIALGLTRDDDTLHDDRIRLWDEFNKAWLTTLQRQVDMSEDMIRMAQPPREPRTIMSSQSLEHLTRQLIRLCDEVEQHGLVDYQMGVAEEEIVELLLRCLSLLDPVHERNGGVAPPVSVATIAGRLQSSAIHGQTI